MSLEADEKAAIVSLWNEITPNADSLGAEALERLFIRFPETMAFTDHLDVRHGSADLMALGRKVMNAIGLAVNDLDSLDKPPAALSHLQVYDIEISPKHFMMLAQSIQVVFAIHLPEFTDTTQAAWDKFLTLLSPILTCKK